VAIVTRYFGVTSAGAGDGTTWADRAALFDGSGNWSTVITGFDFSGSDSLECRVGPGTHECTQGLTTGLWTNPPTVTNQLVLLSADSNGDRLPVPAPDWTAARPVWDVSGVSRIDFVGNFKIVETGVHTVWHNLHITSDATTNAGLRDRGVLSWIYAEFSGSHTNVGFGGSLSITNCAAKMTGPTFGAGIDHTSNARMDNIRIEGNPDATSGVRRGVQVRGNNLAVASRICVVDCPGEGFIHANNGTISVVNLYQCMAINCGTGISMGTSIATNSIINKSLVVNSAGYGLSMGTDVACVIGSRFQHRRHHSPRHHRDGRHRCR